MGAIVAATRTGVWADHRGREGSDLVRWLVAPALVVCVGGWGTVAPLLRGDCVRPRPRSLPVGGGGEADQTGPGPLPETGAISFPIPMSYPTRICVADSEKKSK